MVDLKKNLHYQVLGWNLQLHTKSIGSCAITHLIYKYIVVVIFQAQVIKQ